MACAQVPRALDAHARLTAAGCRVTVPGGLLVHCSCTARISLAEFVAHTISSQGSPEGTATERTRPLGSLRNAKPMAKHEDPPEVTVTSDSAQMNSSPCRFLRNICCLMAGCRLKGVVVSFKRRRGISLPFHLTAPAPAARQAGYRLVELERTEHAVDHPIGFPEGAYLKALYCRVHPLAGG